jgi:hypothetical protein
MIEPINVYDDDAGSRILSRGGAGRTTPAPRRRCASAPTSPRRHGGSSRRADKKKAQLNCIRHLLSQLDYAEVERPPIDLPQRVRHSDHLRHPVPELMMVPKTH